MSTKIIKSGSSSFTLETVKPPDWLLSGTVTVDIIGLDGTVLLADNAVTIYAGDTVKTAVVAGDDTIELTDSNAIEAGSKIAIGSVYEGYQYRTVIDFDATDGTIELDNCLDKDIPASASVIGLEMSSVVDVSVDAFEDIKEVQIQWKSDTEDLTMQEMWRILEGYNQADGLIYDFKEAYSSIADAVPDIARLYERASRWMVDYFNTKERDFRKIVDNQLTKEVVMLKMALMYATNGDVSEEMYARLTDDLTANMLTLDNLPIWIDVDEDNVMDDDETDTVSMSSSISRCL